MFCKKKLRWGCSQNLMNFSKKFSTCITRRLDKKSNRNEEKVITSWHEIEKFSLETKIKDNAIVHDMLTYKL